MAILEPGYKAAEQRTAAGDQPYYKRRSVEVQVKGIGAQSIWPSEHCRR